MPIADLPGLPDPVAAILPVIFDVAVVMAPDIWLTAVLFSGYLPTLAACRRTYPWPAAAVGVAPLVDVPLGVLLALPLARWMTRNTIAATPITAAVRYRTIFVPLSRCGGRTPERGPERDRDQAVLAETVLPEAAVTEGVLLVVGGFGALLRVRLGLVVLVGPALAAEAARREAAGAGRLPVTLLLAEVLLAVILAAVVLLVVALLRVTRLTRRPIARLIAVARLVAVARRLARFRPP